MATRNRLIGREAEREELEVALRQASKGGGKLLLLSGDAGMGKTRLAQEVIDSTRAVALRGAGLATAQPPYGCVITALRSHLRWEPEALEGMGPLLPHLAVLLPELGDPAAESDAGTLHEALRAAL